MNKNLLILLLFFALAPNSTTAQTIWLVKHDATGLGNGTTWQNAFPQLNMALDVAAYGDTVWVAAGTYYPTTGTNRDTAFMLRNGVSLFGGFAGSETSLTQRNWKQNPTILSGDIGVPGDSTDNVFNVMRGTHVDTTTYIDGFTIEYGYANENSNAANLQYRSIGGGMYLRPKNNTLSTAPVIRNCTFRKNYAFNNALAIASYNLVNSIGNARINHCTFFDNYGGKPVVYQLLNNSNVYFTDNSIGKNNSVTLLSIQSLTSTNEVFIERDTFLGSGSDIGITYTHSGFTPVSVRLKKCHFLNWNMINLQFGGFDGIQSKIQIDSNSINSSNLTRFNLSLADNLMYNNSFINTSTNITTSSGGNRKLGLFSNIFSGGIVNQFRIFGELIFEKNIFINNRSIWRLSAGAIHHNATFSNSIFHNSRVSFISEIDGLVNEPLGLRFQNCSFLKHRGYTDTSSVFQLLSGDSLTINSCLFSEPLTNTPLIDDGTTPMQYFSVTHSAFDNSDCALISNTLGDNICATASNQIGVPILFVDTASNNFALRPCSVGIDIGDSLAVQGITTDLLGQPRVANQYPDAGAIENAVAAPALVAQTDASCHGKHDGKVAYQVTDCATYNFTWNNNGTIGTQLDSLAAGTYALAMSNTNNGLVFLDTFNIGQPPVPWQVAFIVAPSSSSTANDGTIFLDAINGNGPFEFLWSNGTTDVGIISLASGLYSVTITDAMGCTADYSFEVGTVGANEILTNNIEIMPNPVQVGGKINVEGGAWASATWVNALGQFQPGRIGHDGTIPVENLVPGLYQLYLHNGNRSGIARVLVISNR